MCILVRYNTHQLTLQWVSEGKHYSAHDGTYDGLPQYNISVHTNIEASCEETYSG